MSGSSVSPPRPVPSSGLPAPAPPPTRSVPSPLVLSLASFLLLSSSSLSCTVSSALPFSTYFSCALCHPSMSFPCSPSPPHLPLSPSSLPFFYPTLSSSPGWLLPPLPPLLCSCSRSSCSYVFSLAPSLPRSSLTSPPAPLTLASRSTPVPSSSVPLLVP